MGQQQLIDDLDTVVPYSQGRHHLRWHGGRVGIGWLDGSHLQYDKEAGLDSGMSVVLRRLHFTMNAADLFSGCIRPRFRSTVTCCSLHAIVAPVETALACSG